MLVTRWL